MTLRTILFLISLLIHAPLHAEISASLDRNRTYLDSAVQLTIISDQEQAEQALDTRALEQDFTIAGRSSSTQISMRNGKVMNESRIILSLLPKREGSLEIPPLAVGNEHTPPAAAAG